MTNPSSKFSPQFPNSKSDVFYISFWDSRSAGLGKKDTLVLTATGADPNSFRSLSGKIEQASDNDQAENTNLHQICSNLHQTRIQRIQTIRY